MPEINRTDANIFEESGGEFYPLPIFFSPGGQKWLCRFSRERIERKRERRSPAIGLSSFSGEFRMMQAHPFAGINPKPSPWGYCWTPDDSTGFNDPGKQRPATQVAANPRPSSPEPQMLATQYANMPAALINSLKREKKPFTYTPGGINLSEVLNARLQKRMERKKKYSQEKNDDGLPRFDPPKQVIVMPTYNSPLDMYSVENAMEALEVQAELVAVDKSLSAPSRSATLPRNHTFRFEDKDMDPGRGVHQSKAFRVLQIITDTEEEAPLDKGRSLHKDEMRFTGIRESRAIPSKFFHTLQKITGTEEEEEVHSVASSHTFPQEKQAPPPSRSPLQPRLNFQQTPNTTFSQTVQQQHASHPVLKRPAAFLPIKTSPGYRPVQPPRLSNGPLGTTVRSSGGTNF